MDIYILGRLPIGTISTKYCTVREKPFVVGITGGIGSGKSTLCNEFMKLGVTVIDADIISRQVVEPGTDGLSTIVASFGENVLSSDGTLDRTALRQLIFADVKKKTLLEEILHPRIRHQIAKQLARVSAPYCLLCIPLLVEGNRFENIQRILVVDCPVEEQTRRVMSRDNLTAGEVEAIMETQASREERLDRADDVITNNGDIDSLVDQVADLHARYLTLAASR